MRLDRAEELVTRRHGGARADCPACVRSSRPGRSGGGRETIGDLDVLAETDDPAALMAAFTSLPMAETVVNRGPAKSAIRLVRGPQVDLMAMPPDAAGTYRIHFTGSKEHNVRLRAMARDQGWSLSEKGFLRIGEDGEPLTGADAELRTFPTEEAAYAFLGLPFIEPELRENQGEIEAALAGHAAAARLAVRPARRPAQPLGLVGRPPADRGHDRRGPGARARLPGPDRPLAVAGDRPRPRPRSGSPGRHRVIAALNERFAAEEAAGTAPAATPPEGFRLLHGCELEIRADGQLDFEDELLSRFDVVVASVHVGRRQSRADLTRRTLNGIRSPHVDVIAHPSGRKIDERDDLDLDWDLVYAEAARTGTALEMNGSPPRLDLAVERARRAVGMGCLVAIDSDAHDIDELDYLRWGVSQARRAWIGPESVVNTRSRADLLAWVAGKPGRV